MTEAITTWIEGFVTSGLIYPVTAALVFLDCVAPVFPGESVLTLGAAWSGSTGSPNAWAIFACGVIFALLGDNICYLAGTRIVTWVRSAPRHSKMGKAVAWVDSSMRSRAGLTIIMARFVPWGRWALVITLGGMRYPYRKFLFYETLGVIFWAGQAVAVGYVAGFVVQDVPLLGLVIGLVLGILAGMSIDRLHQRFSEHRDVRSARSSA